MNSRRLMGCPPQTGGRTLPHGYAKTLLCITAKSIVEWQRWAPKATVTNQNVMRRFVPILLQKSPRRSCRIKIRNNRIGANGFLNQRCALTPDLESILRTQTGKILLQQNRHEAPVRCDAPSRSLWDVKQTWRAHRERVDA